MDENGKPVRTPAGERRSGATGLLDANGVADYLCVARKTVYELVLRGDLACYRIGRGMRFTTTQIEDFLARHLEEASS